MPPKSAASRFTPPPQKRGGGGDFLSANALFEKFWTAYPRREAKELARCAWHRLWRNRQLPSLEILLSALGKFRASSMWNREHGRFVPQAVNWLKGFRWLDETQDGSAVLTPEEEEKRTQTRKLQERHEEERKKRDQDDRDRAARLRPLFDAFLARFKDGARMRGPAWGLWSLLHENGTILTPGMVADGESACVMDFLRARKRGAAW